MAFVVERPGGRFEIRESRATPRGPRARTLATFATLDDAVVAHVIERAEVPVDVHDLVRAARRAGAPVTVGASPADTAARALLAEIRAGHHPSPALAAALSDAVDPDSDVSDSVPRRGGVERRDPGRTRRGAARPVAARRPIAGAHAAGSDGTVAPRQGGRAAPRARSAPVSRTHSVARSRSRTTPSRAPPSTST